MLIETNAQLILVTSRQIRANIFHCHVMMATNALSTLAIVTLAVLTKRRIAMIGMRAQTTIVMRKMDSVFTTNYRVMIRIRAQPTVVMHRKFQATNAPTFRCLLTTTICALQMFVFQSMALP